MQEEDVERLLQNTGIIRHRGIQAIISNARGLRWSKTASLSPVVWSFVDGRRELARRPARMRFYLNTCVQVALAKALKTRFSSLSVRHLLLALCGRADWSATILPLFLPSGREEKHDSQIPGEDMAWRLFWRCG